MFSTRAELERFIADLRIPEDRRRVVEAELFDHLESRLAAEVASGNADAERTALAALGDPDRLRASLERVETAFALSPRHAILRGAGSAIVVSTVFAILGAMIPHEPIAPANLVFAIPAAALGAVLLKLLAPRGIGAALVAEGRASIGRKPRASTRRRAAVGYVWSIFAVFVLVWQAWLVGLPESIRNDILMPWGVLGVVFGTIALVGMQRARIERRLARAA